MGKASDKTREVLVDRVADLDWYYRDPPSSCSAGPMGDDLVSSMCKFPITATFLEAVALDRVDSADGLTLLH